MGSKNITGGCCGGEACRARAEMLSCILGMKRCRCSGRASRLSGTPGGSSRASRLRVLLGRVEDRAGEMHTRTLGVTEAKCG